MISLRKVDKTNIWNILKLEVSDEQKDFITTNVVSIVQAYIVKDSDGRVQPLGIYHDETLVGFMMISYGRDDYTSEEVSIADNNYNLWRIMIDKKYQKKGYGRAAVVEAIKYIKTFPLGEAKYCWLSYEKENIVAKKLYESLGFVENGEEDEGEIVAVLEL